MDFWIISAKRALGRLQFGEPVVLEEDGRRSSAPRSSFCRRAGDRLRSRAAEAKLIFWVGADPADLERIRPLLLCMGNKIVHTGGHGTGASMKMVVNLLMATPWRHSPKAWLWAKDSESRGKFVRFIARYACGRAVSEIKTSEDRQGKLRSRVPAALDAKRYASRDRERLRIRGGHASNQRG